MEIQKKITQLNDKIWKNKIIVIAIIGGLAGVSFGIWVFAQWKNSEFWAGVFSNITTAFAVSFLTFLVTFNAKTESEEIIEKLENSSKTYNNTFDKAIVAINDFNQSVETIRERRCVYCTNSLINVKQNRKECELETFFNNATNYIDIYTINLRTFVPYRQALKKASEKGVKIRVLAMHPRFAKKFNALRIIDGDDPCNRWRDMKYTLLEFINISEECKNLDVKVYTDVIPTCVLIRVDQMCYVSYLLNGKHSSETVHLLFEEKEGIPITPFSYLINHIDRVWLSGGTYNAEMSEIESCNFNEQS